MRAFLRPAALGVLLVFAALPAASVACEWACSATHTAAATSEHHQHAAMHHAADADTNVPDARVHEASVPCHVSGLPVAALSVSALKVAAAPPSPAAALVVAPARGSRAAAAPHAIDPPPGGRSAPFALRI